MAQALSRILAVLKRLVPVLLIFLVGSSLVYDRSLANGHVALESFPVLSLKDIHSLLVVAPHPDDETLGQGGLIQQALTDGIKVYVVVVTNGDGQEIAPPALGMSVIPKTADFIAIGERRQHESLSALQKLGVSASNAFYLSYPDRGMKPMWIADWNTQCPYYSTYTRSTASPYPITYGQKATYCGWNVLHDLQEIITRTRPDLIVMPHPDDQHPDHLAVSNFTRMADVMVILADPSYHPELLGYLVHYGYFPEPRGFNPAQSLLPPLPLSSSWYSWIRYDLTPPEEITKISAVNSYTTQMDLMRKFLVSFDRIDEPFMQLSIISLPYQGASTLPVPESTSAGINVNEPSRETSRLLVSPGADIIGWEIQREGDSLLLTVKTKGKLIEGVQYITYIKTPDGKTYKYTHVRQAESSTPDSYTTTVSLTQLGDPPFIAFSAQTRQDITLDNSAWEFALLGNAGSVSTTPTP